MKFVEVRLKVFDMANPNGRLLNTPTKAMLSYSPILLLQDGKETVVGVISLSELEIVGKEIFVQCHIKECYADKIEFFNYEIEGKYSQMEKGFRISHVNSVIVKLKVD